MTLIDSNILLDILTANSSWRSWSESRLQEAALEGPLLINDVIFAESSIGFRSRVDFEEQLSVGGFETVAIPRDALFLAGKAFTRYRAVGGLRTGVLPDFFIGAHATVSRLPLLTRDVKRYRTYFPTVKLITP